MALGKIIQQIRSQRKISLHTLAKETGLSSSYLSLVESEDRNLSLGGLGRIAEYLHLPLTVIFALLEKDKLGDWAEPILEQYGLVNLPSTSEYIQLTLFNWEQDHGISE